MHDFQRFLESRGGKALKQIFPFVGLNAEGVIDMALGDAHKVLERPAGGKMADCSLHHRLISNRIHHVFILGFLKESKFRFQC